MSDYSQGHQRVQHIFAHDSLSYDVGVKLQRE